ncbi:formyltransferase family protein [Candidatus Pelagibacter sp.]|uniref:formyltransferase family protein n=1 Tax=Candidatus Pelagibacter sp. TaxID=2024849 RepID=UPI003F84D0BA
MKITLFTSNDIRHEYLTSLMSNLCDSLYIIQEVRPTFEQIVKNDTTIDKLFKQYFYGVIEAQKKIFDNKEISNKNNITHLKINYPNINKIDIKNLSKFFDSDLYIVFGSSFIKGELIDYLIKNNAINIHAGLSPFYRGTDCNFWALYDNNPHLVGSTIHYLARGLDDGPIISHALSKLKTNSFEYTMSTLKSAFVHLGLMIKEKKILKIKPVKQDVSKEIRYSKRIHFDKKILKKFYKLNLDLNSKSFDKSKLINPFFY